MRADLKSAVNERKVLPEELSALKAQVSQTTVGPAIIAAIFIALAALLILRPGYAETERCLT